MHAGQVFGISWASRVACRGLPREYLYADTTCCFAPQSSGAGSRGRSPASALDRAPGGGAQGQGRRRSPSRTPSGPPPVPEDRFPGLKLGPLLGQGSYGQVFRGTYQGEAVAVKVRAPRSRPQLRRTQGCGLTLMRGRPVACGGL